MNRPSDPRLPHLARIADIVLTARLARLNAARKLRNDQNTLLCGLQADGANHDETALALAALRHQKWSEARILALQAAIRLQDGVIDGERRATAVALARNLAIERMMRPRR